MFMRNALSDVDVFGIVSFIATILAILAFLFIFSEKDLSSLINSFPTKQYRAYFKEKCSLTARLLSDDDNKFNLKFATPAKDDD